MRFPRLRRIVAALLVTSMVTGTGPPFVAQFLADTAFAATSKADVTEHCDPASMEAYLEGCEHGGQCVLTCSCCGSLIASPLAFPPPEGDGHAPTLSDRSPSRPLRTSVRARSPPKGSLLG